MIAGNRLEDLAGALVARIGRPPASVLYLTRNDVEPARALEAAWPQARVTVRTKADFQGMSQAAVMSALRHEPAELFIVHDRPAFMAQLADLYRIPAIGVRARRRFLLSADIRGGRLAGEWELTEVTPLGDLPGLVWRLGKEKLAAGRELARARTLSSTPSVARTLGRGPSLRVAYLRSDLSFVGLEAGGSVSHTLGVIGGLLDADHRVDVLAADAIPGLDARVSNQWVVAPRHDIRTDDEAAMIAYHHKFVADARAILTGNPPDLLYQRHAVFNATGAVLARSLGIPLILEANHTEVEAKAMWSRLRHRALAEQFEQFAFDTADAVVAVSAIGATALAKAGADPAKILVNPNGVDPTVFRPDLEGTAVRRRLGFTADHVVCGFLGTFTRWHGVLFLADQVASLVARHPTVRFLFMGDGDLRSAVEDRLRGAGVADRAVFTGLIPHAAVPEPRATPSPHSMPPAPRSPAWNRASPSRSAVVVLSSARTVNG